MERNKPYFIVILLLAATTLNAAPTIETDRAIVSSFLTPDTPAVIVPTNEAVGPIDTKLANLGREFLQPPTSFAGLSNAQGNYVKPLPPVPAAIVMVLSGFLCVSLVRDRRVWLTALVGLLWAGQTGIQALPQLALRLSHGNHRNQQPRAQLAYPHYLENSHRFRSDIDDTQYIGLLRHLAGIPDNLHKPTHSYTSTSQPAIIIAQTGLNPLLVCLAPRTEQLISFSPAFIFANLARGPPIRA